MPEPKSTQELHPLRSTIRTAFQVTVALATIIPYALADLPFTWAWVGQVVAVAAGITRAMADPRVADILRKHVPWLAPDAEPPTQK